jgi:hypothetical protein
VGPSRADGCTDQTPTQRVASRVTILLLLLLLLLLLSSSSSSSSSPPQVRAFAVFFFSPLALAFFFGLRPWVCQGRPDARWASTWVRSRLKGI